jgi:hypothetical protein
MGKTITEIEELNNCESVKSWIKISENVISVTLKDSRDLQFNLDNWYLSNINNYQYTTFHLRQK